MIDLSRPHIEQGLASEGGLPPGVLPDFVPVPHGKARHDGWTPIRQRRFIEALADCGSVKSACKAVNMTFAGVYRLRRQPGAEEFRAAWEAALALGVQRLEDVAMERALHGVEETVWHNGKAVGTRRVYNERLLMFVLRNRTGSRFAADSIANAGAATRSYLMRLKKEWRAEWEAEQAQDAGEVLASLNAKLERMRERGQEAEAFAGNPGLYGEAAAENGADGADGVVPDGAEGDAVGGNGDGAEGAVPHGGSVRIVPHLLTAGDAALGLPRGWVPRAARAAMAAREAGGGHKALIIPPSAEELAVAQWVRGEALRGKMPGATGPVGTRKDGGKRRG